MLLASFRKPCAVTSPLVRAILAEIRRLRASPVRIAVSQHGTKTSGQLSIRPSQIAGHGGTSRYHDQLESQRVDVPRHAVRRYGESKGRALST